MKTTAQLALQFLEDAQQASVRKPFVFAISGSQGSGKSYLMAHLESELKVRGLNVLGVSLDDFYRPASGLAQLQRRFNGLLFATRGLPGTHDVDLLESFLDKCCQNKPGAVKVPAYDKSLRGGAGDRIDERDWQAVTTPLDVVIIEGWCVGFKPVDHSMLHNYTAKYSLAELEYMNDQLGKCHQVLDRYVDALLHLDPAKLDFVYDWRQQQEHELIQKRGMGMNPDQVRQFVDGYMVGYELYLDGLRAETPHHSPPENASESGKSVRRQERLKLDHERRVVEVRYA